MSGQISLIARLEWTLLTRSGAARVLGTTFVVMVAIAIASAAVRVSRSRADAALLNAGIGGEAPSADEIANERGVFAVLPPAPLLGLAAGQSDIHPTHYRITARTRESQLAGDQIEHPLVLLTGRFDLAFAVLYLFSLLVAGMSHDLVASERATGTLRMLVVQGASTRRIATGKVAARLAAVIALPIAAAVASAATGVITGGAWRLVWWTIGAIVYGVFWLGVAVQVNARGRSAPANALTLAGLWLTFVVLIPSLVNLATRSIYPIPSRVELAAAMRDASREAVAQGSRTLGRFLEDHPSAGTGEEGMRQYYLLQEVRDREVAARLQPLVDAFGAQLARQTAVVSALQYTSPIIVAQLALTDIAGTSGHRIQAFNAQASAFQREWQSHFPADVLSGARPLARPLPAFVYDEEPLRHPMRRTLLPIALLGASGAALIWTGLRRFDRLPVGEG